jgi:hypothetical protein
MKVSNFDCTAKGMGSSTGQVTTPPLKTILSKYSIKGFGDRAISKI